MFLILGKDYCNPGAKIMDCIQLKLCDIQGRLFKLSTAYASEGFIRDFMNSKVAEHLDSPYNKLQWMGEEYLMDDICIATGPAREVRRARGSTARHRQRP